MRNLTKLLVSASCVVAVGCSSVGDIDTAEPETGEPTQADAGAERGDGGAAEAGPGGAAPPVGELAFVDDEPPPLPDPVDGVPVDEAGPDAALASVVVPLGGDLAIDLPPDLAPPATAEFAYVFRADGPPVGPDGVAIIDYVMASFDGTVVERSRDVAAPFQAVVGDPGGTPPDAFGVPSALENALIGRPVGSRITVAFPVGMPGLPSYLDDEQAHVLVVDIVSFQAPVAS